MTLYPLLVGEKWTLEASDGNSKFRVGDLDTGTEVSSRGSDIPFSTWFPASGLYRTVWKLRDF